MPSKINHQVVMSSSESEQASKRAELKKLQFQKSQELKKAKSKQDKQAVEDKYRLLEESLKGPTIISTAAAPEVALPDSLYKERERSKAQLKKERKKERLAEERAVITASVGDGSAEAAERQAELDAILERLPGDFEIFQIEPNGDCLFSSIAMQLLNTSTSELRNEVANYLESNKDEFAAFVDEDFGVYVSGMRKSSWGSDVELEAVSRLFRRRVEVFTATQILEFGSGFGNPVRLSFHERQYSSPHYNAVIPSPNHS